MAKTRPVPCTKQEIEAILNATLEDDFYYMLFFVAKSTGRRLGEYYGVYEKKVVGTEEYRDRHGNVKIREIRKRTSTLVGGVQVKDIDFERKTMMTYILKRRKYVQAEAILTDEALRIVKQYIASHKLKLDDYLFRKRTMRSIQQALTRYAKKAGVNHKVVFHNFRHYFVTELLKKGVPLNQVAKLTAHGSTASLGAYDHSIASDFRDKVQGMIEGL